MTNKSHVDVAFDIVSASKNPISFNDLWKKIVEVQGLNEEEAQKLVGSIYTQLLLDGRFINLGDNTWDLRDRYTFEKATLDTNECYSDDEDDEIDPEENEDEEDQEDEDKEDSGEEESEEKSSSEYEAE